MFPWRLRLLALSLVAGLYLMVASLVSVTQRDAASLAERRILQQEEATLANLRRGGGRRRGRHSWPRSQPINWCRPLGIKAAPGPVTALASFPGSGNTWLRYLLQQATGISTGSVYKDFALLKNGFPMESVSNGSVLVVKTHEWGGGGRKPFDAAMLLIREPGPSILAEFNRRWKIHQILYQRQFARFCTRDLVLFSPEFPGLEGTLVTPAQKSSRRRAAGCGRTLCGGRPESGRR